jgi:hypothetical protein
MAKFVHKIELWHWIGHLVCMRFVWKLELDIKIVATKMGYLLEFTAFITTSYNHQKLTATIKRNLKSEDSNFKNQKALQDLYCYFTNLWLSDTWAIPTLHRPFPTRCWHDKTYGKNLLRPYANQLTTSSDCSNLAPTFKTHWHTNSNCTSALAPGLRQVKFLVCNYVVMC